MAVHSNFTGFLDSVVKDFNIDINFVDPADGKNVLDYTQDEIFRLSNVTNNVNVLTTFKTIYAHLVKNLNAKHSPNYKPTLFEKLNDNNANADPLCNGFPSTVKSDSFFKFDEI